MNEQSDERQQSRGSYRSPVTVKTLARLIDCRAGKPRCFQRAALSKVQYVRGNVPTGEEGGYFAELMTEAKVDVRASSDSGAACNSVSPPFAWEGVLVTQRRPSKQLDPVSKTPVVLVVDDDPSLREALGRLFRSVDLESRLFSSVAELLLGKFPGVPCCLVLDIRLPGVSGLDFQTQLANSNIRVPIIMMTGHGDIPMSVRAMKGGAVDFLTKPFRDQDMLDAVAQAIERDRKRRDSDKALAELRERFECSRRESGKSWRL